MAMIGLEEWKACHKAAMRVYNGQSGIAEETRAISENTKMNPGSARDYIGGFIHLLKGEIYTRTMSVEGTKYLISKIREDFGAEQEKISCEAILKHVEYYKRLETGGFQRKLHDFAVARLNEIKSERYEEDFYFTMQQFDRQVQIALSDETEKRRERLKKAPRKPQKKIVRHFIFIRNPDVVAEALLRSSGHCEACDSKAPFNRKSDNSAYLEIHHRIPLAEGGEDTLENVIALCPNCHRESHFGKDWEKYRP